MRRAWLLAAALALALLPTNVVSAALPLLQTEWDSSAVQIAWVFAAYQVGYVASVVLVLPLTDRVEPRAVMGGCAAVTTVAFLLFPLATGEWSAALLRFVAGLGLSGVYLPGVRIVAEQAGRARSGAATALYVSAFYLGSAASLWGTATLLPRVGWRGAALVLACLCALAVPLTLLGASAHGSQRTPTNAGPRSLDLSAVREPSVARHVLAYTGHCWELYVFRAWMPAFLASAVAAAGVDPTAAVAQGSRQAALMSALGAVGVLGAGWASDRLGRVPTAAAAIALSGSLSLVLGFAHGAALAVLLLLGCLYGIATAADSSLHSAAVVEGSDPGRVGSAQAVQAFSGFGASIVGPVAAGWLLDLGLGWPSVFVCAGVVGLALAVPMIGLLHSS